MIYLTAGIIAFVAYMIGYRAGSRMAHKKWENAFKQHGHVEMGKHGTVLSIGISHRDHFWRPSPEDPNRGVIPDQCRHQARGAPCVHWCGNKECMK